MVHIFCSYEYRGCVAEGRAKGYGAGALNSVEKGGIRGKPSSPEGECMEQTLLPSDIFAFLSAKTLGQDDILKQVSVAVYKHINGLSAGNLLLIGNSGTGKTTIMNTVQQFYAAHQDLERFQAMTIVNANMLEGDDQGEVKLSRLLHNLENAVYKYYGRFITDEKLKEYMENATVCVDEVDKISGRIGDRVNVAGITVQHALLTMLEGEAILYETTREEMGKTRTARISIDTARMLFICGGAFEGLHEIIASATAAGGRTLRRPTGERAEGSVGMKRMILKENLTMGDLFTYGMAPQFISRFSAVCVLADLGFEDMKRIFLTADDSPLRHSYEFFRSMNIDLKVTKSALELICRHAVENSRIGARALREVFSRVIANYEFDPHNSGHLLEGSPRPVLTVDDDIVKAAMAD